MSVLKKMTMLALGIYGFSSLIACSDQGALDGEAGTGEVGFALQLPAGTKIESVGYVITGPGGFVRDGVIDVSTSTKLTAMIGGIPAGSGYQITLTATTTDGLTSCTGSAAFDVLPGKIAAATVLMTCHEEKRTGSVLVDGRLNICPTIDSVGASPAEVQVGSSVALSAAAHDSDAGPSPLSFGWTASDGSFSDPAAQRPTFRCTNPGTVTLHLTVSDGDPAASCADTATAQVICTPPPRTPGTYVAGDFHNHTTCSDGSISMEKLVKKATDRVDTPWGLDWFVQAGHGGSGNRNCTLVEDASLATPAYPQVFSAANPAVPLGPNTTWQNSNPPVQPKGLPSGTAPNRNMWRWQSLQEFQYPLMEYLAAYKDKPLFIGIESVVAGHEHASASVITG